MKKILQSLVLTTLLLSSVACSKSEKDQSNKGDEKQIVLDFMYFGTPFEKRSMEASIDSFEKSNPDIKINSKFTPQSDYDTKLLTLLASGNEPDIAYASEKHARDWYQDGKVKNLYPFYSKDDTLNYDTIINSVWWDVGPKETIGTNTAVETFGIFYNEDLFKKHGIELMPSNPKNAWTWEQFVDVAQILTIDKNGKNAKDPEFDKKNIQQYGFSMSTWTWIVFMQANGGEWLSKDGNSTGLTSEKATEGLQKLSDLINKYHVMPSPTESKSVMQGGAAGSLASQKIAMRLDGNWLNQELGEIVKKEDFKYQIGVLPILNEETGSITMGVGAPTIIFEKTKNPEAAWKFMKWLSNPETSIDMYKGGLWMPLLKEYYTNPTKRELWVSNSPARPNTFYDAMGINAVKNNIPWPSYSVKNFLKQEELVKTVLSEILDENKPADQVMKKIEPLLNKEVKNRYANSNQ